MEYSLQAIAGSRPGRYVQYIEARPGKMFNELYIAASQVGIVCETVERKCVRSMKTGWATLASRGARLTDRITTPHVGPMSRSWLAHHDVEFPKRHPDS